MPLIDADHNGGVILTDWYTSSEAPKERLKANVYITNNESWTGSLEVSIFKQVLEADSWVDTPIDVDTPSQIENAILTRSRQLYIDHVSSSDKNK